MNHSTPSTKAPVGLALLLLLPLLAGLTLVSSISTAQSAGSESPSASLTQLFAFSGVTDDGEQGGASGKEATSVLCTNLAPNNAMIEVRVFNWDGTQAGLGTVTAVPNATYTFSTQYTTIYYEDVILAAGGGTPAIFQGSGQVWSDQPDIICTAEILDPVNYPPLFMDKLTLFTPAGYPVGDVLSLYLPGIFR